jgi:serine/threonine protein kinase
MYLFIYFFVYLFIYLHFFFSVVVKLGDFGLAKYVSDENPYFENMFCGTPDVRFFFLCFS